MKKIEFNELGLLPGDIILINEKGFFVLFKKLMLILYKLKLGIKDIGLYTNSFFVYSSDISVLCARVSSISRGVRFFIPQYLNFKMLKGIVILRPINPYQQFEVEIITDYLYKFPCIHTNKFSIKTILYNIKMIFRTNKGSGGSWKGVKDSELTKNIYHSELIAFLTNKKRFMFVNPKSVNTIDILINRNLKKIVEL